MAVQIPAGFVLIFDDPDEAEVTVTALEINEIRKDFFHNS